MIELLGDEFQRVPQGDEVDHILVFVQRTFDLGRYAVVVTVQTLADVFAEGDEMGGAEDVIFLVQTDPVSFRHGSDSTRTRLSKLAAAVPRRMKINQSF